MAMGGDSQAQQAVNGPAIALLVTAILGIVLLVLNLILMLAGVGMLAAAQQQAVQQQGVPPAQAEQMQYIQYFQGTTGVVSTLVGVAGGILVIMAP
jgi:hypothetical protein